MDSTKKLGAIVMNLSDRPNLRLVFSVVAATTLFTLQAHATVANSGGIAFVQTVNNYYNAVKGIAYGATGIGTTFSLIALHRNGGHIGELGHSTMGLVGLAGLTLGVGSLLTMVPGVSAAII
jgi:hypothetical protein